MGFWRCPRCRVEFRDQHPAWPLCVVVRRTGRGRELVFPGVEGGGQVLFVGPVGSLSLCGSCREWRPEGGACMDRPPWEIAGFRAAQLAGRLDGIGAIGDWPGVS